MTRDNGVVESPASHTVSSASIRDFILSLLFYCPILTEEQWLTLDRLHEALDYKMTEQIMR